MQLSLIIPTHNPRSDFMECVLSAIKAQTLPIDHWELIIVDNKSVPAVPSDLAALGHPSGQVIREDKVGLTAARLCGFSNANGEIMVLVDDDNVLSADFLSNTLKIAQAHPQLGAWSGRVDLKFTPGITIPPKASWPYLAHRDPSTPCISTNIDHHNSTPWGAGMCIRRAVTKIYIETVNREKTRGSLDLQGKQLIYGGDTDIAYTGCKHGYSKGVFPDIHLTHLIPPERCTEAYFIRAIEGHGYSEQLHRLILGRKMEDPHQSFRRWASDWWHAWKKGRFAQIERKARRRGLARAWRELSSQ